MRTIATTSTSYSISPSSSPSLSHSSWHSPIPYLFGGLAAMLGLIAFALLILACSYWRLTGQLHDEENNNGNSEKEGDSSNEKSVKVYEEKFLVIMAGDQNPTFLATPVFPKSASVMDLNSDEQLQNNEAVEKSEKETETEVAEERNQNQQQ
ncbi:unnamed protein product [Lathyrus sativus]|nr:unnamed protein product [Lathyrus sativus]